MSLDGAGKPRPRYQIDQELYAIGKKNGSFEMNKIIWERFRKSTISKLSNEQAEILIDLLKDKYGTRSKRLPSKIEGDDQE